MKRIAYAGASHYKMTCCECGGGYEANSLNQIFCGRECRNNYSNRRNQRGAILYDIFMEMRYRRNGAKGLWSIMCRLAEEWREEDFIRAGGDREKKTVPNPLMFKTWKDPRDFLEKRPYLKAARGRI